MPKVNYVGRLSDSTYRVGIHSHDSWEAVCYTDGFGVAELDGQKIPFEEGDIFIIPPGLPHTDYSDAGFKNYYYSFSEFEPHSRSYLKLRDSDSRDFRRILEQMYLEYHLKRKNWKNLVDSLYEVLYQYILSFSDGTMHNPYVSKAVGDLIANLSNPKFSVEEMVAQIPLNGDYFRKLFQEHTGKTPLQFLTAKRISYAKQLLRTRRDTRLSVKEIAWRSGFSDYYYFSRVFKKATGCAPTGWGEEKAEKGEG